VIVPDILVELGDEGEVLYVYTRLPDLIAKVGRRSDYREGTFPYVAYEW